MNYLLGLIFATSAFISLGQKTDLLKVQRLNVQSEYYLNVNRDSVHYFAQRAHDINNGRFPREKVKTLLMLGMCQKFGGNMDSAYGLFTQAKILAEDLEMKRELGISYWYRGKVFLGLNEMEKARTQYEKAVDVLEGAGEYEKQFKALNGLAYLEQKQGNLAQSLVHHTHVLEIIEREKFKGLGLRTYANIAAIYLQLGDREKGLEFNLRSLQVEDTARYKGHLVSGMMQRANLYQGTIHADSSLYYFNKSLKYCKLFNLDPDFVHFTIGLYHDKIGNHREAIGNFRKGLDASKTALNENKFFLALGRNYLALERYDSALFFAQKGYEQARKSNLKQALHESSKILADIFVAKGDAAMSNKFLYEHTAYKDSVFISGDQRKLTNLQVQLETIDKAHEIELLKSKAAEENFKRLLLLKGGSLVIFLFFVVLVVIVQRHNKKQKVQQFTAASLQNEIEKGRHDLSNQSLHLIRVNNSVLEIEEKLKELMPKVQGHSMDVQRLINTIRVNKSQDKDWENFNNYFNGLNSGFADRMREQFPSLTVNEIRLCALLKMNLLNGEIASILNVETRSVTMSKYRMKKKLNLSEDVDLATFLMNLEFPAEEKRYA